jgi:hypothetical protein
MTLPKVITFTITIKSNITSCERIYYDSILVIPSPAPETIKGDSAVCYDQTVLYSVGSDPQVNYTWGTNSINGIIIGSDKTHEVTIHWDSIGTNYTAKVLIMKEFSTGGCIDTDVLFVNVYNDKAPMDSLIRKHTIDSSQLFLMCWTHINSDTLLYSYDWGFEKDGIDSLKDNFKDKYFCIFNNYDKADKSKSYFVDIAQKNGPKCITRTQYSPSAQEFNSYPLKIFPNPNRGTFNINLEESFQGKVEILVYSLSGTLVAGMNCNKTSNRQSFPADFSRLAPGLYLIKATYSNGESAYQKLSVY